MNVFFMKTNQQIQDEIKRRAENPLYSWIMDENGGAGIYAADYFSEFFILKTTSGHTFTLDETGEISVPPPITEEYDLETDEQGEHLENLFNEILFGPCLDEQYPATDGMAREHLIRQGIDPYLKFNSQPVNFLDSMGQFDPELMGIESLEHYSEDPDEFVDELIQAGIQNRWWNSASVDAWRRTGERGKSAAIRWFEEEITDQTSNQRKHTLSTT